VTEKYTAYKTICVPETRTCAKTVHKLVPSYHDETYTTYKCVPCYETRTITKRVAVCREVCETKYKCVDKGHYECCTVEKGPNLMDQMRKCWDCCYEPCPRYKTKKVWVPCMVQVPYTCKKTVKDWVCVPETVQVCTYKSVPVQNVRKVCTYKCVSEVVNETYTVHVSKCVPYEATRCVAKCVPCVEKVTACRLVARKYCKQVPVCECCTPCRKCCK
jgi:hypothetical protein